MQNGTDITNGDVSNSNKVCETINTIFSFDNLYDAYLNSTKGVKWKYSTQNYCLNACCRIARLYKKIQNGTYKTSKPKQFTIFERGKERNISALTFEDRLVNKCLCDNYLNTLLTKSLIHDNGATIKGKGLSFTKKRAICHLQKYYRKYKNNGYVLKVDIHHYFESINHEILFSQLAKKVKDEKVLEVIKDIVNSVPYGLGLGSQVSQICAIYYLNELDHYIKEKLKCKFYARYMDDFYILSPNYNFLVNAKSRIIKKLKSFKLKVSKNKTRIYKLKDGFVFCKTRYLLTDTGKVLRLLVSNSVKSMKRKIKLGIDIKNIIPSFMAYISEFNCYKIFSFFNKYYIIS